MKILHVTNAYPSEKHPVHGIFVKEQLESLKKLNIEFDLYFVNAKDFGKSQYLNWYFKILRNRNKYDLIHCHHFLVGFLVLLTFPRAKVLISFLSDGLNEFMLAKNNFTQKVILLMYNWILKNSDGRIFKNRVPEFLKEDPYSFHLPNGVNMNLFQEIDKNYSKEQLKLDKAKRYILFCSLNNLYRPEKRYDIFTEAVAKLKEEKMFSDVEELHLINAERHMVPFYFNASECYMLTSDFEGSPNAVKECLSTNTPVISRNVGDVSITLKDLKACHIINSADINDYVLALKSILNNSQNADNLRRQVVSLNLDMESKAKHLKEIYQKII